MTSYEEKLQQEANLWGSESERMAQEVPPDWRYHRHLRHNLLSHTPNIDALLQHVQPGMRVLELGCASGWLTLAMAQRGAQAEGLDLSQQSLDIAQAYYQSIRADVAGTVTYQQADLNQLTLEANAYDLIVVKGTLHHLVNMAEVIAQVHAALKPGGLFWVSDTLHDEHPRTVLVASALMFLLPTHTSYRDKIQGLLKFGVNAPARIKASMEAEGLSPFEGAGRDHDWMALIEQHFHIEKKQPGLAITGYITHQIKLPDALALPILRLIKGLDRALLVPGILRNSAYVVLARKQPASAG